MEESHQAALRDWASRFRRASEELEALRRNLSSLTKEKFFSPGEHGDITLRDAIVDEYKLAYENLKVENKEAYFYKVLQHYDRDFCACDKHLAEVKRMKKQRNIFAHEFRAGKPIDIDAAWASLLRVADANGISLEFYTNWANHIDSLCDNDPSLDSRYNIPGKNGDEGITSQEMI